MGNSLVSTVSREEWEREVRNAYRPSLPHQRRELGMYLFVASLSTFFIASLLAYGTIRVYFHHGVNPLQLPLTVVFSTVALLAGSYLLQQSLKAVRRESLKLFQQYILSSLVFGGVFCLLQTAAITQLLVSHWSTQAGEARPYGLVFVLILLHALHFLGGLIFLGYVAIQGMRGKYDHEYHSGVKIAAIYWRFLDVIWLLMIGVFALVP